MYCKTVKRNKAYVYMYRLPFLCQNRTCIIHVLAERVQRTFKFSVLNSKKVYGNWSPFMSGLNTVISNFIYDCSFAAF